LLMCDRSCPALGDMAAWGCMLGRHGGAPGPLLPSTPGWLCTSLEVQSHKGVGVRSGFGVVPRRFHNSWDTAIAPCAGFCHEFGSHVCCCLAIP
jgi:hypothetical protein